MNEHYPKAYKTGTQDFYGRDFKVNQNVLIPRPETEMIIDMVLNLLGKPFLPGVKPSKAKLPKDLTVVDVGTGSGCIAITLKIEVPEIKIVATDISEDALDVARKNAAKYNVDLELLHSDLLNDIKIHPDLVIANLPYVDKDWGWLDTNSLSYEPAQALFADNHGLALIFKLIDQTKERGVHHLIIEADPCQHQEIVDYAAKKGLKLIETRGFALYLSE